VQRIGISDFVDVDEGARCGQCRDRPVDGIRGYVLQHTVAHRKIETIGCQTEVLDTRLMDWHVWIPPTRKVEGTAGKIYTSDASNAQRLVQSEQAACPAAD